MSQINKKHLEFVEDCRIAFDANILLTTYENPDGTLIGLRYGADRDCIKVLDLGEEIGFFAQMMKPTNPNQFIEVVLKHYDKEICRVRSKLRWWANEMETQLKANDHKGGWEKSSERFLTNELAKNLHRIQTTSIAHSEYRRRCANIANFAMMLADNDRREEASRL